MNTEFPPSPLRSSPMQNTQNQIAPIDPREELEAAVAEIDGENTPIPEVLSDLTKRELQVLTMLALGSKNSEIAEAYNVSIKTVDTHRGNILKKLGLRNNVDLARLAIRTGFVGVGQ